MASDNDQSQTIQQNAAPRPTSGNAINQDDANVLREWYQSLVLQDPRYDSKDLFKLAARAMGDDEIRWRLIHDAETVLNEDEAAYGDLPEGVTLRFWDNTADTLHVVLPPRPGNTSKQIPALREFLSSRTAQAIIENQGLFSDDFNDYGDVWDKRDKGDKNKDALG
ncbi:hypothetical protein ACQEU6_43405 [Spirillospora sp. CA-108201]